LVCRECEVYDFPIDPTGDGPTDHGNILTGSIALGISLAANAVGSVIFWLIAAHLVSVDVVGSSQGMFQALLFVNYLANFGLPMTLARFAGPEDVSLANWITAVRVVGSILSTALFLVASASTQLMDPVWAFGPVVGAASFAVFSLGLALAILMEARLMTLRRWRGVAFRGIAAALGRIPLLAPLLLIDFDNAEGAFLLLALAIGPVAVTGYVTAIALRLTSDREPRLLPARPAHLPELVRFSMVNWLGLVATQGPVFAVPLIVAFSVDGATNAPFYVAWQFGAIAFVVPQAIAQVALSEASQGGAANAKLFRALQLALLATCVATIFAQFGAGLVARVYGPEYAHMTDTIPLLVVASVAWSYAAVALTATRLTGRDGQHIIISMVFLFGTMVPTLVLTPIHGPDAAVWSWLVGNMVTAAVAACFHFGSGLDVRDDPQSAANVLGVTS
jgi:O-antigen/teichoic acid export membrane protein